MRMQRLSQRIEALLFARRSVVLLLFALASLLFAWQASGLRADASLEKTVPHHHPFVANAQAFENELRPLGNVLRIAVATTAGSIYSPAYVETLKKITDEVFFIPGVDRANMKSLWTPNVLWAEVTEQGFAGGVVMPTGFDGSPAKLDELRLNVLRSGRIGSLVAADGRSSMLLVPLLENDPETGRRLDYGALSQRIETQVRDRFQQGEISVHVTGQAKIIGDLIEGGRDIALFFGITVLLSALLLWGYSRCWRSTLAVIGCCLLAVVWQLGVVRLLGFGLDPYSMLVPFLTFAIGVSHAVQNINTVVSDQAAGLGPLPAARRTFALLFVPGTNALLCDAVGFSTLLVIDIGVIRELAISACVGVAVIVFTKMFLLPVIMSYIRVSPRALKHQRARDAGPHRVAQRLSALVQPRAALAVAALMGLLLAGAWWAKRDLQIGDLDRGAPELRAEARYNRDNAYIAAHYSQSPDVFVVIVRTPPGQCGSYEAGAAIERLTGVLQDTPGVESSHSLFDAVKTYVVGSNAGDLRWHGLSRNRFVNNAAFKTLPTELYSSDCAMLPLSVYLADHKAQTLRDVVQAVEGFAAVHNGPAVEFLLAAGNAGIDAATNDVIERMEPRMMALVYALVALLVWWEFRSWRVTVALMLPLYVTSVLCEAIMAQLGLGVKVATLPVVALGVGIGVDYGIYIWNRMQGFLDEGMAFRRAYFETLKTTGVAVAVTGVTLALGVATWVFSSIKYQADMGLLLVFMFLWNMLGAIFLMPALARLLRQGTGEFRETN
ncbi:MULTISPECIES: MMPL family transporter [unclassified Variovorax]|uniref:efflux RND transporter permease subunit n=1 Tax=unclassified Variovorax TaxID=663243 RepID=UPI002576FF79|nr:MULTISPECIES: MMPL family transporter [unclassified Variovorax]MDM0091412.1 MMPL family transporter [Variovorax sp. J22G40]MDM0149610.1 MMPL family transporter [Variovorax sp. J2P1-31]